MNATNLFTDDDAVSPVIGVILMVAVTVILATVIASAVLGLGQTRSATMPQASLSVSVTDGDNVTVAHDGGDSIAIERVSVTTTGSASTIPPGARSRTANSRAVIAGSPLRASPTARSSASSTSHPTPISRRYSGPSKPDDHSSQWHHQTSSRSPGSTVPASVASPKSSPSSCCSCW
ncbi:type IV pilin [Halomicroarcula sp. GCM10025709]|uniref:type IV pilin n=1 Tax=Halomicroarcula sp. GCM10025709 TaxID=3252669 RepID=UPI0036167017